MPTDLSLCSSAQQEVLEDGPKTTVFGSAALSCKGNSTASSGKDRTHSARAAVCGQEEEESGKGANGVPVCTPLSQGSGDEGRLLG